MEVTNKFKGLDLIHKRKKSKKVKWLSEQASQISERRRKRQRLNAGFQKTARRDKKVFLSER